MTTSLTNFRRTVLLSIFGVLALPLHLEGNGAQGISVFLSERDRFQYTGLESGRQHLHPILRAHFGEQTFLGQI